MELDEVLILDRSVYDVGLGRDGTVIPVLIGDADGWDRLYDGVLDRIVGVG